MFNIIVVLIIGALIYLFGRKLFIKFIMSEQRWIFVCLFVLPLSLLFDLFWYIRNIIIFKFGNTKESHEEKVRKIQIDVKNADKNSLYCTARPTWLSMRVSFLKYKSELKRIDVSNLFDILEVVYFHF
jgi:Delta24-sterol reductase